MMTNTHEQRFMNFDSVIYRGMGVNLHVLLTSALDRDEWLVLCFDHLHHQ